MQLVRRGVSVHFFAEKWPFDPVSVPAVLQHWEAAHARRFAGTTASESD
jgi:hypothetical protein